MSTTNPSLPPSWLATTLGQVVDYGATEKVEPGQIAPETWILELEDIERDSSRVSKRFRFSERRSKSTKNQFSRGDVLYGKLRPYLNKVVYADAPGVCTTEIVPIKPGPALNGRYLFHWLRHPEFCRYVTEVSHGVNMPRLGTEAGKNAPLVLPPLREQERIADKLDTVLARVDACRDRLDRVDPLIKRFRQSVLAAATSGQLTEDWRESDAGIWTSATVESLCTSISDGPFGSHLKSEDYVEQGARVVRLENIGHLFFDRSKRTFISTEKYNSLDRHSLVQGDLLFSSFVDEEVRVCSFPADLGAPAINKADCFCLRVNRETCDPMYLMYRLACKTTYLSLKKQVHGATRPRINLGQLRRFELLLPSRREQAEIVRRVGTLFAFADRLEACLTQAQTAVDRLTPSLLAKAFRGELVPQDPADEPAGELLKRLAAQRVAAPPKARKARRSEFA